MLPRIGNLDNGVLVSLSLSSLVAAGGNGSSSNGVGSRNGNRARAPARAADTKRIPLQRYRAADACLAMQRDNETTGGRERKLPRAATGRAGGRSALARIN